MGGDKGRKLWTDHEVMEVYEPTRQDRRRRYFSERMIRGHKSLADRRWQETNGLERYIGE